MTMESQRIEQFKDDVNDMHVPAPTDSGERGYLIAGVLVMLAGVVVILGGWFGASGTAVVAEQIPYLLSGGLLGLGLVIIGAALFVRYSMSRYLRFWLIRLIYEQRAQTDKLSTAAQSAATAGTAAAAPQAARPVPRPATETT